MQRNSFESNGFLLAPVFDFSVFAGATVFAGDEDIDDFVFNDAQRHFEQRMAMTYTLTMSPDPFIYAFVTLQNDAVKLNGQDFGGFPYRSLPAVKIGRLGVRKEYQSQGIGSFLVDMIAEFMCQDNRTGCRFMTLDAYNNERTIAFYRKKGFLNIIESRKLANRFTIPMYRDLLD